MRSTMLYTMMQVDRSPEAQVAHGRASTEQTYIALRMEPLVIGSSRSNYLNGLSLTSGLV